MAKELPFFKFEISEWMFGRIQKQPLEVQGTFINLCCKYWHKLGELSYDDACLDFGTENIKLLVKNKLVWKDSKYLSINFLNKQLDECEKTSQKNSLKGLKSAEIRATRRQLQLTTVEPLLTGVQPNPTEEIRRDKKRGEERKHHINPFDPDEFFETIEKAFEEIRDNQKFVEEECVMTLSGRGWKSVTPLDIIGLLKYFMSSKFDIQKPKREARQHFKNWLGAGSTKLPDLITRAEIFKKSLQ